MIDRITPIAEFLLQLDPLKSVERRSYINGGERVENSAEHSWHLALACWAFAEQLQDDFDVLKLLKLALVHDLGEIGAGDTFLYSPDRKNAHVKERGCVSSLAAHAGNPIGNLMDLWEDQETGDSKEAKLLRVVDRLLPFLHNLSSEGQSWRENGIRESQVLRMHEFIAEDYPEIHSWFLARVEYAVARGWLEPD